MPEEPLERRPSITKRFIDIIDECGVLDNIVELSHANTEIRELEVEARNNRPPGTPRSVPLYEFLPQEKATKLKVLRARRDAIRSEDRDRMDCAARKIREEGIVGVKTKRGLVIGQLAKVVSVEPADEAKEIRLPTLPPSLGNPMRGECVYFARALREKLGEGENIQVGPHNVLLYKGYYIDATGVYTKEELQRKYPGDVIRQDPDRWNYIWDTDLLERYIEFMKGADIILPEEEDEGASLRALFG